MVDVIYGLPDLDIVTLHRFADRLSGSGSETAYHTATELLTWWLARVIRAGGGVGEGASAGDLLGGDIVPGEEDCARRLLDLAGVEQWIEVWDKVTRLLSQADGLNLDRKQIVLNAFHAMQGAAHA